MSAPAGTRRGSLAAMDTDSCCSSDGFGYSDEEDLSESSEDGDYGFDPHAEVETSARQVCRCLGSMLRTLRLAGGLLTASDTPQAPYVVFSEEQLRERQDEAVSAVTGVLSISKSEAVRVLRQCKWCALRPWCQIIARAPHTPPSLCVLPATVQTHGCTRTSPTLLVCVPSVVVFSRARASALRSQGCEPRQ